MQRQPRTLLRFHQLKRSSFLVAGLFLAYFALPVTAQTLTTSTPTLQLYPTPIAPDAALFQANFGSAVSASGNILASGETNSPYSNVSSRVRILSESGGAWSLVQSFNVFPSVNYWVNVVATNVSGNAVIAGIAPSSDEPYSATNGFRIYQLISSKWTETAHVDVAASDGIGRAQGFGSSVAIDGSWAAVGNAYAGTVSMYHASVSGTSWSLQTVLHAQPNDPTNFGRAVALEGSELLVGMPGDFYSEDPANVGAVATFNLSGGTWSRGADVTSGTSDGGLQFGWTLARHGNLVAIGARGSYSLDQEKGKAFVFVKQPPSSSWSLVTTLAAGDADFEDMLTQSLATDGVNIVAGTGANKAYLFAPDGTGGWQQNRIDSPVADGFLRVEFGVSVALSGDGNALIGAPGDSSGGVAFGGSVYEFPVDAPASIIGAVTMGDTHDREQFGAAIDSDGPLLAIGTPLASGPSGYNTGDVTVYVTDISQSNLLRKLATLAPEGLTPGDGFGDHLAVSNGRIAALSTYGIQVGTGPSGNDGAAYIYKFDPGTDSVNLEQRIPHPGQDFGWGTSIAFSDNLLAVGATNAPGPGSPPGYENDEPDTGVVYVFQRDPISGLWSLKQTLMVNDTVPVYSFGSALAWCGNRLIVGAAFDQVYPSASGGAVYVFAPNAGTFTQQTKIVATGPAGPPRYFGSSVACTRGGTTLGVGSSYGEAFIFEENPALSGTWSQVIRATIPQDNEAFLTGLRFIQNTLYVAVSPSADTQASEVGSVHTLDKANGVWQLSRRFTSVNARTGDGFGTSIGKLGFAVMAASPTKPVAPATNVGKVEAFGNVFEIFASGFEY